MHANWPYVLLWNALQAALTNAVIHMGSLKNRKPNKAWLSRRTLRRLLYWFRFRHVKLHNNAKRNSIDEDSMRKQLRVSYHHFNAYLPSTCHVIKVGKWPTKTVRSRDAYYSLAAPQPEHPRRIPSIIVTLLLAWWQLPFLWVYRLQLIEWSSKYTSKA